MLESLSLESMPDQLNKHLNKKKEFIHGLVELLKESLDNMPADLNEQGELTAGLVMLLKKSIASEKKATAEIVQLQEDKAKLCHELDLLKEKNAGWKKLHENSKFLDEDAAGPHHGTEGGVGEAPHRAPGCC